MNVNFQPFGGGGEISNSYNEDMLVSNAFDRELKILIKKILKNKQKNAVTHFKILAWDTDINCNTII